MYYTVIKHSGHLRTLNKCRKHSPAARVFCISLVFSNDHRVLSQCNTRLRLLYLLNIQCSTNDPASSSIALIVIVFKGYLTIYQILMQPGSQVLSPLPPLVIGRKTLIAACHVTTYDINISNYRAETIRIIFVDLN